MQSAIMKSMKSLRPALRVSARQFSMTRVNLHESVNDLNTFTEGFPVIDY